MIKLYYGESIPDMAWIKDVETEKEAYMHMQVILDNHNKRHRLKEKFPYFRSWVIEENPTHQIKCVDFGSHSNFFFLKTIYSNE